MKSVFDYVTGIIGNMPEGFQPAGKLTEEGAFAVYQRGYVARLTDMLGETFENVWKVLGDDDFFRIAEDFIRATPSQSYNLSHYSEKFIEFLRTHELSAEFTFLPDLARVAWLKKELFDVATEQGLGGPEVLQLLEQNKPANFVSSMRMVKSEYTIHDLWSALSIGSAAPEEWNEPQFLVLYKSDSQVYLKPLNALCYETLEAIADGKGLLTACEKLEEADLTSLFQFLAQSTLLKAR